MALTTVMPSGTSYFLPEISIVTIRGLSTSGWSITLRSSCAMYCSGVRSREDLSPTPDVSPSRFLRDCVDDRVQRRAGAHRLRGLCIVRVIVPADVLRFALCGEQFAVDFLLVVAQIFCNFRKSLSDLLVSRLRSQSLRPVERQVEVAATVVDLADLTGWRFVALEELRIGLIERVGQDLGHRIIPGLRQVLQRRSQCEEFAERVPTQIAFLLELLHVLWCRSSRAGLEQATTVQQRDDREHLGAGADFENGEQVCEVVTEHVAGAGNRVLAFLHPLQRKAGRFRRRHDPNVESLRI